MKLKMSTAEEAALTLVLRREEIPVFRALLDRAGFVDVSPDMQAQVIDLVERLREEIGEP